MNVPKPRDSGAKVSPMSSLRPRVATWTPRSNSQPGFGSPARVPRPRGVNARAAEIEDADACRPYASEVENKRIAGEEARLIARAKELVPLVRGRADAAEAARRIPTATDRDFRAAGFYRALQPRMFGGLELPYGVHTELAAEIARGCPSSGWVLGVIMSHAFIFGMLPLQAQEELWGHDPDATVATSFFPDVVTAVREGDGFRLRGRWKFSSGVDHAQAVLLMATAPPSEAGDRPEPFFLFVPHGDYRIEDTWHAAGLIATGSNDVLVDDAFVPAHRALPVLLTATGQTPGGLAHGPLYRLPLFALFGYTLIGPALGGVQGALDALADGLRDRASVIGVRLREQQSVQLRIAEAQAELDAARELIAADRRRFTAAAHASEHPDVARRVRYRMHLAFAARLCVAAIERLVPLLGAQGIAANHPVQRAARDVHAVAQHIGLAWDVQATNYGAVALGLDPPDRRV